MNFKCWIMENLWTLIKGEKPVFVMFYADWCPHCRKMMPIVGKLEKKEGLTVLRYDIDDTSKKSLIDYYQVKAVPLMMIYKSGEQLWRWNGEISERELFQTVDRLTGKAD